MGGAHNDGEPAWLRILPLGGLGRIGGNLLVLETAEDLVIVDCGLLFPDDEPGVDYIIPDVSYVLERRHKLRAYVLTHGHEDHIGALPFVYRQLSAPIYATAFTRMLLQTKLGAASLPAGGIQTMRDGEPFAVGSLRFLPIPVTHSIPGAVALGIDTPIGTVVHTGDFNINSDPVDGRQMDLEAFEELGDRGVQVLLSDSTNADTKGSTWSEREVATNIAQLISEASACVFVCTFASNLHRLQAVLQAAHDADRKVILAGRSVQNNVQMALENGFISVPPGVLVEPALFGQLEPSELVVLASGCQGEPRSAMARLSNGGYSALRVRPRDRVIMSSRRIPGNERHIGTMINNLLRLGAEVIDDRDARVHTSGHAYNDEQLTILRLCRPRFFMPVHGELRHLLKHAALATSTGVADDGIVVVEDGTPVEFECGDDGALRAAKGSPVPAGLVFIDAKSGDDIGDMVVRDRRILARSGVVICTVVYSSTGELHAGPTLVSRGIAYLDEGKHMLEQAAREVRAALEKSEPQLSNAQRAEAIRQALRRFLRCELDRRPLVVPVVLERDDVDAAHGDDCKSSC